MERPMKAERMDEIVDTAAKLFDEYGFHQTTMEVIARHVGIAKPTLYHYLSSKEEILSLIHDRFYELLVKNQRGRMARGMSYDELIRATIHDIVRLMETHRSYVRVFFEHHRELPAEYRQIIDPKRDDYFRLVVSFFQVGIDEGHFKAESAALAALAMFGMCNWSYTWFRPDGAFTADEVADWFWSWLTGGLAAGHRQPAGSTP